MALLLRSSTGPRRATAALATSYYNRSARARMGPGLPGAVLPPPPPTATHTSPRRAYATHASSLDLPALDRKWRRIWSTTAKQDDTQAAGGDRTTADYILPMFPYPSGLLHLGHLRVYTIADTIARFRALQGRRVLLPMGWDAFGLPAENAARERGVDPAEWTRTNIGRMRDQLDMMNGSWDWSHEITTCDPDFYRHTQKLFLMLHSRGLAYQAEADVNYDPVDGTVLANEQVGPDGRSWRSGALVERRRLTQWFFRISAFRDDLLRHLDALSQGGAWPERVLAQQRSWLGRSEGVVIKFPVLASGQRDARAAIDVFTTRPDTLFGVQYLALSAHHPAVAGLAAADPELQAFLDTLPGLPPDSKVGYLLPHVRAVNPLGSCCRREGEEAGGDDTPDDGKMSLPIYVAPYVVGDYGEGAVMGVPGHDLRDHAFWREHGGEQPIRVVLASSEDESTTALENRPEPPPGPFTEHGILTADVGPAFRGKSSREAGRIVAEMLERAGLAARAVRWRLRDWLISRQRYWGTPIPIIHCARAGCGPVPVPDEDLPVLLPDVGRHWEEGGGGNPLEGESAARWREDVVCPRCGGPARRDTDTMDTFVDSSWYYARFADPHNRAGPFSNDAARAALPVDLYIGGVEHAILHLLYARFVYKFLATTPLLAGVASVQDGVAEPFRRLVTQGMVNSRTYSDPATGRFLRRSEVDLADPNTPTEAATGRPVAVTFEKMSKSKHNGVDPSGCIAKHGADATRAHLLFQAPVGEVLNWDEDKISGITRWFDRIHDLVKSLASAGREKAGEKGRLEAGDREDDAARVLEYLEGWHGRLAEESSSPIGADELKRGDANTAIWRELQAAVGSVTSSYQDVYSLNTAVSDLMILTNTILQQRALADYVIVRAAASALVVMLAPIAPAVAEECWSILRPGSAGLFSHPSSSSASSASSAPSASGAHFPVQDGTSDLTQPRLRGLAVQVNGRLRAVVQVPPPAKGLEGAALREWITERILEGASKAKFGPGGEYDLARATKVIVAGGGETINFVL